MTKNQPEPPRTDSAVLKDATVRDSAGPPAAKPRLGKARKPSKFDADLLDSYKKNVASGKLVWKEIDVDDVDVEDTRTDQGDLMPAYRAVDLELRRAVGSLPGRDPNHLTAVKIKTGQSDVAGKIRVWFAVTYKVGRRDQSKKR